VQADLVLEGGGVKGIALVGAVTALADAGYSFPRVAGSSAGAVVASLTAALQSAGEPLSRLTEIVGSLDYRRLRDPGRIGRLPVVGRALALLLRDGLYEGRYLEDFLAGVLGDLGVRTFADLRLPADDPAAEGLDPERAYRLVVTVSDLSRKRLTRLPWDLQDYGVDDLSVARAVRASAAIPFFFRPVRQPTPLGPATWVDGGLLSNFPVGLFDRPDTVDPRWPTFGVRLTTRPPTLPVVRPISGPIGIGLAALDTLLTDQGNAYLDDDCTVERTIFVPTPDISIVDFDLDAAAAQELYESGRTAAERFLAGWDFAAHVERCRRRVPRAPGWSRN
jgi:NTE family protein